MSDESKPAPVPEPDQDDEEEVVGVVKYCPACDEKTVHVDGVCRDHKVIRRRVARPAVAVADEAPVRTGPRKKKQPKPPEKSTFGRIFTLAVLGGLIFGLGSLQIIHGAKYGTNFCRKHSWSLSKTIVDLDEYGVGGKKIEGDLLATMGKCGIAVKPATPLVTP